MTHATASLQFSNLMQVARKRPLTVPEKRELTAARQFLRSVRKGSRRNPRGKYRFGKFVKTEIPFAYKGYYVNMTTTGDLFIEKDGILIGWAKSKDDAKRIIDELTNENPGRRNTPYMGRIPTPRELKAVSVGATVKGHPYALVVQFANEDRAMSGIRIMREDFGITESSGVQKSATTKYYVVYFLKRGSNPRGRKNSRYPLRIHRPKATRNPRTAVKVYGRLLRIEAQKTQKHTCDAACKRAKHCYFHDFRPGASIYGMPDGSLVIK